jgi:2-polyprenyl-3-methyl-5-hydroxy-6-metoxy-1,4-benzoquinol methylase
MEFPGPLKNLLRGGKGAQSPKGAAPPISGRSAFPPRHSGNETTSVRGSRGLEEFFRNIRDQSGLTILDLGGATQQNVSFITNLGHRLYSEDFLQILNETFGADDTVDQANPGRIEYFLRQTLDYPEGQFDGVLIWDVLEYLEPALLLAVVERLHKIVRPKSYMLSFFHSDDKLDAVPFYTFRIQETNTLHVAERGMHRPVQLFNNRSLEKLFSRFDSVKFFLTRERLREVIVKV